MLFRFRKYVFAQSFYRSIEKLLHYSILWFFTHWWSRLISFFEHLDISKTNRVDSLISALLFESHRYKFEISTNLFEKIVAIDSEFDDCFRFFFQKLSYDLIVETNRSQNSLYLLEHLVKSDRNFCLLINKIDQCLSVEADRM